MAKKSEVQKQKTSYQAKMTNKGFFRDNTVEIEFEGKKRRVSENVAKAIKERDAKKAKAKK